MMRRDISSDALILNKRLFAHIHAVKDTNQKTCDESKHVEINGGCVLQTNFWRRVSICICVALVLTPNLLKSQTVGSNGTPNSKNGIDIRLVCGNEYVDALHSFPPIPAPSLEWEKQAERYRKSLKLTPGHNGLSFPPDYTPTNILLSLHGSAFVLDPDRNRYAVILPHFKSEPCAVEFSSVNMPIWADGTCAAYSYTPPRTSEIDVTGCLQGSQMISYLQFVIKKIANFTYVPGFINTEHQLDDFELVFFGEFSNGCDWPQKAIVGLFGDRKQFTALIFKGLGGKTSALFSDECMVAIAKMGGGI